MRFRPSAGCNMADRRPCPVCGSRGDRRVLHRQRFYEGILGDGYDVVACAACGAGFADGIPPQAAMDLYYAEQSKYSYDGAGGAESTYDLSRFERIADQVIPHLPGRSVRILDIGCATGGLLSVFRQRGFTNVVGADPSPSCAAAARRLHGVEVRTATLGEIRDWDERFDLVLMVGVLEHLREAAAAVTTAATLLRPDGLFYAAVPDVEGLTAVRNAPFQQFSMEHVNFFSMDSLRRLLGLGGFVPRKIWQDIVEWREGVTEPVLAGLFTANPSAKYQPDFDKRSTLALENYVIASAAADVAIQARIDALVENRRPLLVWGAGALTRRLLISTPLAQANITAFVDSNPHLWGLHLCGRPVLSPAKIADHNESILICSVAFEREIIQLIREQLKLTNRLISLAGSGAE